MSAYDNRFLIKKIRTTIPPIIHEDDSQNIQGGIEGEHYHLTAIEHTLVQRLVVHISEPVASGGELIFADNGDCVVA